MEVYGIKEIYKYKKSFFQPLHTTDEKDKLKSFAYLKIISLSSLLNASPESFPQGKNYLKNTKKLKD